MHRRSQNGVSRHISLAMWGVALIFTLAVEYRDKRWSMPWALGNRSLWTKRAD